MKTMLGRVIAVGIFVCAGYVRADFGGGVSDDKVSLPEGPGSLEGVGENVAVNENMGAMSYHVPFDLPSGFAGATPGLGLTYNSGGGISPAGVGWTFGVGAVDRMTVRGLPKYVADDEMAADESEELIRVSADADTATNTVTVSYEETGDPCDCMCVYNLNYTLTGLTAGDWTINADGDTTTVNVE